MTPSPRLVLFVRYPAAGVCKTRLIPALGSEGAAALHRQLTERTAATLLASGLPVTIAFTGASSQEFADWLGGDLIYAKQVEGDLSAKLLGFLAPAPVIFFGADTPDLQVHHVAAAIDALQTHEVVIGPAEDGGYYLIGLRSALPEVLSDMPWSTDRVFPETLLRLRRLGVAPKILETLADCDRPEDLVRWPDLAA